MDPEKSDDLAEAPIAVVRRVLAAIRICQFQLRQYRASSEEGLFEWLQLFRQQAVCILDVVAPLVRELNSQVEEPQKIQGVLCARIVASLREAFGHLENTHQPAHQLKIALSWLHSGASFAELLIEDLARRPPQPTVRVLLEPRSEPLELLEPPETYRDARELRRIALAAVIAWLTLQPVWESSLQSAIEFAQTVMGTNREFTEIARSFELLDATLDLLRSVPVAVEA